MIKMMTISQPPRDASSQASVTIRALSSITPEQADTITKAVQASGSAWTVQTTDDYDGYLSILVEPTIHRDEQKSFFIAGTAQLLELFESHDDTLTKLDDFNTVDAISIKLIELIKE